MTIGCNASLFAIGPFSRTCITWLRDSRMNLWAVTSSCASPTWNVTSWPTLVTNLWRMASVMVLSLCQSSIPIICCSEIYIFRLYNDQLKGHQIDKVIPVIFIKPAYIETLLFCTEFTFYFCLLCRMLYNSMYILWKCCHTDYCLLFNRQGSQSVNDNCIYR